MTYEGAVLFDIAGPAAVFAMGNTIANARIYETIVATGGSPDVGHAEAISVAASSVSGLLIDKSDTVLIAGGEAPALRRAAVEPTLLDFVRKSAEKAERYGSVCTGAFILAAAGVLKGKRATTHWEGIGRLTRLEPACQVDPDALYCVDGRLWTSAGMATGIDMALAMVEQDHGPGLKIAIAKRMVVYAHRPGKQSQFSDLLALQEQAGSGFAKLVDWLRERRSEPTTIEDMAAFVHMSPRNFHRKFVAQFGETPARVFDNLRLDLARATLETGVSVGQAAIKCGYQSEAAFRSAFKSRFGLSPGLYRETHGSGP